MNIYFDAENYLNQIDYDRHTQFAQAVLESADELESELSITIVNDQEIKQMNQQYRGIDKSTDVLSFSMREGETVGQNTILGDIVISIETAQRQADRIGHSLDDEIDELIFHGMIHLLGGDHEANSKIWNKLQNDLQNGLENHKICYKPKGLIINE